MTILTPKKKRGITRAKAPQRLGINAFFEKHLNAPVNNPRRSWGAYDPSTDAVFLRFWKDGEYLFQGQGAWRVVDANSKPKGVRKSAENERAEHVERIRQGAKGYAVLCVPKVAGAHKREILSYDDQNLLVIAGFVDQPKGTYAIVSGKTPVDVVRQRPVVSSDEERDIERVRRDPNLTETQRAALIDARLGQGRFRKDVLDRWKRTCALTGCGFEPMLRASHIKPWRLGDNVERLDPCNGLPLAAHIDALFDRGFISFTDGGELIITRDLPPDALALIGDNRTLLRPLVEREKIFLAFHRKELFGKTKAKKKVKAPKQKMQRRI